MGIVACIIGKCQQVGRIVFSDIRIGQKDIDQTVYFIVGIGAGLEFLEFVQPFV